MSALGVDLVGNRTLLDLLGERTEATPDATFVVHEDRDGAVRELTYAQFSAAVDRAAAAFTALGASAGQRVVLHLRNSPEFLISWFGLAAAGGVAVPSNTANTAVELGYLAAQADAIAAITDPDRGELLLAVARDAPTLETVIVARTDDPPAGTVALSALMADAGDWTGSGARSDDMLQILFTSGTTARPKGVVMTHANALWSGERVARGYGTEPTDRLLTALPLFHVNAQSVTVLGALTAGARCILLEEFRARAYWDQIRRHEATMTSLVATQAKALLATPPREIDATHPLRRISLAINVSESEQIEFERRFEVRLLNLYGLTEAAEIVAISPLHGPARWPALGLPAFDRRIRVVGPDGADLPVGESGEILVHGVPGRTVMHSYFKDPEATENALVDGCWVRTGDHGHLDEAGYLYFGDRSKDVIKRAGDNVSATEVEARLEEHPAIVEAAVLGVPDEFRGEAVKAFVVLDGASPSPEEIAAFCAEALAPFKVPTEFEIRDALPRNAIGKLQKHLL